MAVALAFLVLGGERFEFLNTLHERITAGISPHFLPSLLVYPVLIYLLVWIPVKRMRQGGMPASKVE